MIVDGASAAIEFYTSVLGAIERMRMPAPEDKVGHAELVVRSGELPAAVFAGRRLVRTSRPG